MSVQWMKEELRLAILQVLLAAWKRKPEIAGESAKMLTDCLQVDSSEIESALCYLREKLMSKPKIRLLYS